MTTFNSLTRSVAVAVLVAAWPLMAAAQASRDPHHPAGTTTTQSAPPTAPPPAAAPAMPGMGGMMGGQGGMMGMMGGAAPGMAGAGPHRPGMATIDHVEGRIAFLKAELAITDAQAPAWNAFAEALRANAKTLREVRTAMMLPAAPGETRTLTQQLDLHERWLAARLEGTRAMKAAFAPLHASLSADQKKAADTLMAPHMGMGPMAMMGMGGPRQCPACRLRTNLQPRATRHWGRRFRHGTSSIPPASSATSGL